MEIRPATVDDAPSLAPLLAGLEYPNTAEMIADRIRLYHSQGFGVFVADEDEDILGFIAISLRDLFINDVRSAHVEGIYVDPRAQGRGLGKMLIARGEGFAREKDCTWIDLTSGKRRAPTGTHAFYHSLGYGNDGHYEKLYFRKKLI